MTADFFSFSVMIKMYWCDPVSGQSHYTLKNGTNNIRRRNPKKRAEMCTKSFFLVLLQIVTDTICLSITLCSRSVSLQV